MSHARKGWDDQPGARDALDGLDSLGLLKDYVDVDRWMTFLGDGCSHMEKHGTHLPASASDVRVNAELARIMQQIVADQEHVNITVDQAEQLSVIELKYCIAERDRYLPTPTS